MDRILSDDLVKALKIFENPKFTFREINGKTGYIEVDSVFACSLPRPGERVDLAMLERVSPQHEYHWG